MTASTAAVPDPVDTGEPGTVPSRPAPPADHRRPEQGPRAGQGARPGPGSGAAQGHPRATAGRPAATGADADRFDVVTLGESMVTFLPSRPGRLADVPSFERAIGGAESNVACGLAAAGHRVAWVSRVGADGFGEYLVDTIGSYGVDTRAVQRDPQRPTGIYFRTAGERVLQPAQEPAQEPAEGSAQESAREPVDGYAAGGASDAAPGGATDAAAGGATDASAVLPAAAASEVVYYRAGSAASAMSCANMPADVLRSGRVLHLTGITAALSPDCRALLRDLTGRDVGRDTDRDRVHRPLLSFDVNHRVGLWRAGDDPGDVLRDLARRCDVVFVGDDEAHALWGVTGGPDAVRAALPEPGVLVVKQGSTGVTVFHHPEGAEGAKDTQDTEGAKSTQDTEGAGVPPPPDTVTFVPALRVDVVAPVGAGDAFAAGFLSATLRGLPVRDRVRHGHLTAAAVLTVPGDLAAPPTRAQADRLAALDAAGWAALHLAPGWTGTPPVPGTASAGPEGPDSPVREVDAP